MRNRRKKILRMENIRRAVQILCFLAFLFLFFATVSKYDPNSQRTVLPSRAPIDLFFRIDPLLGITTMISIRQVIDVMLFYALPIVLLTFIAGRFFCGWICPLGTSLDIADKNILQKKQKRRMRI